MPVALDSVKEILNPAATQEQLEFSWFAPAGDLACVVERHWAVRWDFTGRRPFLQEVLPHPCANLCFEPGGALVHGVITRRASHLLEGSGNDGGCDVPAGRLRELHDGADQAHFTRDFRALVGCSPGAYELACSH